MMLHPSWQNSRSRNNQVPLYIEIHCIFISSQNLKWVILGSSMPISTEKMIFKIKEITSVFNIERFFQTFFSHGQTFNTPPDTLTVCAAIIFSSVWINYDDAQPKSWQWWCMSTKLGCAQPHSATEDGCSIYRFYFWNATAAAISNYFYETHMWNVECL